MVKTSTRTFPNRLRKRTNMFLAAAGRAAIASRLGKTPSVAEHRETLGVVNNPARLVLL